MISQFSSITAEIFFKSFALMPCCSLKTNFSPSYSYLAQPPLPSTCTCIGSCSRLKKKNENPKNLNISGIKQVFFKMQSWVFFLIPQKKILSCQTLFVFLQSRKDERFIRNSLNDKGKVAEWSIATVLKTADLRGSGGSNPSLSAKLFHTKQNECSAFFVVRGSVENLFSKDASHNKKRATGSLCEKVLSTVSAKGSRMNIRNPSLARICS